MPEHDRSDRARKCDQDEIRDRFRAHDHPADCGEYAVAGLEEYVRRDRDASHSPGRNADARARRRDVREQSNGVQMTERVDQQRRDGAAESHQDDDSPPRIEIASQPQADHCARPEGEDAPAQPERGGLRQVRECDPERRPGEEPCSRAGDEPKHH